ncbi:MAG TPA: putative 2-dehydropantoate 2-reductase [Gammaproteobacteria bacterium]|nr:putative 2-dehydropantoate 2-reductase [Gammaproteobacteria bacterium]
MIWHILGAGSLGCLWAARLAADKHTVHLLLRDASALARYRHTPGVGLSDALHQHTAYYPIHAQLADHQQPINNLLLACKAYDAEAAISQVAERLSSDCQIILLQNGLGSQQAVQKLLPKARCIAASSTEGAYLAAPFHSVFAGSGHTWLGDLQSSAQSLPQELLATCNAAGISCTWTPHIAKKLWRKLAINCAINPLTVIHNCLNGALTDYSARINTLCDELQQLLHCADQPEAAHELHQHVWTVIDNTAANSSSMRQDVLNQRRTEISYISGFACTQSQALGCYTPTLDALHSQLEGVLQAHGLEII